MSDYIIETTDLSRSYGSQLCVEKVCIHVPKGKIYALLGRNGAGKTTTMKMLLNLSTPTSGKIEIFGHNPIKNLVKTYSHIGSMIETPSFYENLTGRENLEIIAKLRGYEKKDIIEEVLHKVNLDQEDNKVFGKYSLGMKQRLGIAAAIMHKPEILILDEPTNGLDPIGIQEMLSYLVKLCRESGMTVFISSHILSEIEQIADVIGIMDKGKLLEEKSMDEFRKQEEKLEDYFSRLIGGGTIG